MEKVELLTNKKNKTNSNPLFKRPLVTRCLANTHKVKISTLKTYNLYSLYTNAQKKKTKKQYTQAYDYKHSSFTSCSKLTENFYNRI